MNQQGDVSNASAGAISFVCQPWKGPKRREKTNPAPSGELTASQAPPGGCRSKTLKMPSSYEESFTMPSRLPRVPSWAGGMSQRTRMYSGGDGMAMPDADDDDVGPLASDSPMRHGRTVFGSLWWALTSAALVAALMGASAPWWLLVVAGAELCAPAARPAAPSPFGT